MGQAAKVSGLTWELGQDQFHRSRKSWPGAGDIPQGGALASQAQDPWFIPSITRKEERKREEGEVEGEIPGGLERLLTKSKQNKTWDKGLA